MNRTGTMRAMQDPFTSLPLTPTLPLQIAERIGQAPPEWNPHPKLTPILERRRKAVAEDAPLETLARWRAAKEAQRDRD